MYVLKKYVRFIKKKLTFKLPIRSPREDVEEF